MVNAQFKQITEAYLGISILQV